MEQEGSIGIYSSAVSSSPRPYGGQPTVGYHRHPLHLAPLPDLILHYQPRDQLPSTPSNSPNDSHHGNEDQPLPPPSTAFFRPVDFENPRGAEHTINYPPTPTDSEGDGSESASSPTGGISVILEEEELWKTFSAVGNEMIVTKPGRRLFPSVMVSVRGLNPRADYTISLRMRSADKYRYKFLNLEWVRVGESELMQNEDRQIFKHPSSPNSGQFWMKKPISFKTVKISHNSTNKHILLYTMHKYELELVVAPAGMDTPFKIKIPDTTFMAVTSYQNIQLTQLKIDNNPFAKGFRDRDMAVLPRPPAGCNRRSLPLWQMPHLSYPLPYISTSLSSVQPPFLSYPLPSRPLQPPTHCPADRSSPSQPPMLSYPLPSRGSPDFTADRSSPSQSSVQPPPFLSYPLPSRGSPDFTADRSSPSQSSVQPPMLSYPLPYPVPNRGIPDFTPDHSSPLQQRSTSVQPPMVSYPCMPWAYGPLASSPYTSSVRDEH